VCFEVSISRHLQTLCEYWANNGLKYYFLNGLLTNAFSEGLSGMLCSVNWLLLTDISGQVVSEEFLEYLTLKDGTGRLS
jgi:hypothetical protein